MNMNIQELRLEQIKQELRMIFYRYVLYSTMVETKEAVGSLWK
jgi:hypothetical protein